MLAVIRLRGSIGVRKELSDTMKMLGLKRINTLTIIPRTDSIIGMIKKVEDFVTWGELAKELEEKIRGGKKQGKVFQLNPPKKGLKSIKKRFPNGDLGYRGKKINDFIKRMM